MSKKKKKKDRQEQSPPDPLDIEIRIKGRDDSLRVDIKNVPVWMWGLMVDLADAQAQVAREALVKVESKQNGHTNGLGPIPGFPFPKTFLPDFGEASAEPDLDDDADAISFLDRLDDGFTHIRTCMISAMLRAEQEGRIPSALT